MIYAITCPKIPITDGFHCQREEFNVKYYCAAGPDYSVKGQTHNYYRILTSDNPFDIFNLFIMDHLEQLFFKLNQEI